MKHASLLGAAMLAAASMVGCADSQGAGDHHEQPQTELGSVNLSLVGRGTSGTTYVLHSAVIMVQGPSSTEFYQTDDDPTQTAISAEAPAGAYYAFLQEGWKLAKVSDAGDYEDVEAVRTSENPLHFTVTANETTYAALTFRVGDDVVGMGAYQIGIEVDDSQDGGQDGGVAPGYCSKDADCGEGQTCCLSGFLGTCSDLSDGSTCALPDLTVVAEAATSSIDIHHETFAADSCALVEGCVDGSGDRRLLAFDTQTPNIGQADVILGDPTGQPGFEYSDCHGHYHFEGYAIYQLLDHGGNVVRTGHKQAFCLLDSEAVVPGANPTPRYHCQFQGIQAGWSDVYGAGLDCQWIDITGVEPGDYVISMTINADHTLPESNYDNNTVTVPVHIPEDTTGPIDEGDPLASCPDGSDGGMRRNCGWTVAPEAHAATCTPGERVTLGCDDTLGSCSGDTVLRVCEGEDACTYGNSLTNDDDSGSDACSIASFVCPPSGVYTALVGAYNPGEAFTCQPAVAAAQPQ